MVTSYAFCNDALEGGTAEKKLKARAIYGEF